MTSKSSQQRFPWTLFFSFSRTHLHPFLCLFDDFLLDTGHHRWFVTEILDPLFLSKSNICSDSVRGWLDSNFKLYLPFCGQQLKWQLIQFPVAACFAGNLRASPVYGRFNGQPRTEVDSVSRFESVGSSPPAFPTELFDCSTVLLVSISCPWHLTPVDWGFPRVKDYKLSIPTTESSSWRTAGSSS